jgi:hypothetical protein
MSCSYISLVKVRHELLELPERSLPPDRELNFSLEWEFKSTEFGYW